MSEDNSNKINDSNDSLKEELDKVKSEKAALEMKLRKADEDLYSEDYLEFLQSKKDKQPDKQIMTGSRLNDYSDEEIQNMPISKLVGLIRGDVIAEIRNEQSRDMTRREMEQRKKNVARAKVEIKEFAAKHTDFPEYVDKISELADANPNLNIEQLYILAGGKLESEKKEDNKTKPPPDTRSQVDGGVKKSDKNLTMREVIMEEYRKLK